jgi:hypothetical protein
MAGIGLPEILIVLVIAIPLWAFRGFPLPRNRIVRSALMFVVAFLLAVLVYNWTTTFRPVPN